MASVTELAPVVGVIAACEAVGVARATFYRHGRRQVEHPPTDPAPSLRHEGAAGERSEQIVPGRGFEEGAGELPPATRRAPPGGGRDPPPPLCDAGVAAGVAGPQ